MTNRQFLAVVGVIMAILFGLLVLEKYRECFERGYTDCPMRGRDMTRPKTMQDGDPQ
jgi:hypothetical protein